MPDTLYQQSAINDMLGRPPGWLLTSGLSALAVVTAVVLTVASFVSYPERVEAPFILQTRTVPLPLRAGATNHVAAVLVPERARVTAGDTLLVFRSEGNWRSVSRLGDWLRERRALSATDADFWSPPPARDYPAGPHQVVVRINSVLEAYRSYVRTNGVSSRIAALRDEVAEARNLSSSLARQVTLYDRELAYQDRGIERTRLLEREGLISTQEAEQLEVKTISAQRQREVLVAGDVQNRLRVSQLRQQMLDLELNHRERVADFERQLRQELRLLGAELAAFSTRYLLIAPESGTLDWQPNLRENALVDPAEPIGFIIPAFGSQEKVARLQLPAAAQGRTEVGNRVLLELDAYPAREFGQLRGALAFIDPLALPDRDEQFAREAVIHLPDTLLTSYGREVPFQYNLTGSARIITRERTLLGRVFDQFLNLVKNK